MITRSEPFPTHTTLTVGAVSTHVAERGLGKPVLMLHGNPDTHTAWAHLAALLAPQGLRCIAPDLPDFGTSVAPDDFDCSLSSQSRYVGQLLDALSLEKAHLVVHDVGGVYGLAFASEHPERVLSLTIFNTLFHPDFRWHFWARMWRTPWVGEAVMAFSTEWLFVRETRKGSRGITVPMAKAMWAAYSPRARRMVLRYYREMDPQRFVGWEARLREATVRIPTQVLWGDSDPFIALSMADRFGGEVHHYAAGGHWLMLDEPEPTAQAIAAHIGRAPGA